MSLSVVELHGSRGLRRFVNSQWEILSTEQYPAWIPPLRLSTTANLDVAKNPFFRNATRALFLAEESGRQIGRLAAIYNGWAADAGLDAGFMGFFESVDRQDVADALLRTAEQWLRDRGCRNVTGPMNPSTNYEGGVLVEGFEHPQTFFTPWNPPYYSGLLERAGYVKAADLLGWHVSVRDVPSDLDARLQALSERASRSHGLEFGLVDFSHFDRDMAQCWEVYQRCWAAQWGFVPLSVEEWLFIANELKPLLTRAGCMLVRASGILVGFGLFVADYNRAMSPDRSGRLLPFNWWRLLRAKRRSPWARIVLAGALPEYRQLGVPQMLLHRAIRNVREFGVEDIEASWTLENNLDLNPYFGRVGATPYRRWRVYQRQF